jgi:hypothetical protein
MKPLRIAFPTFLLCATLAGAGCTRSGHLVTVGHSPAPETGDPPVPEALASVAPGPLAAVPGAASAAARLPVPPGHLPRVGLCRVWVPGVPPGRQALARTCENVLRTAPPGSMVIHRPVEDRKQVQVFHVDPERSEAIARVQIFDAGTGRLLRESRSR